VSDRASHAGREAAARDVFASGAYWREYYATLGHENRVAGEFLREVSAPLSDRHLRILDAGCGPTALYWAVFLPGRHEHHGFDLLDANVRAASMQIEAARRGTWDPGLLEAARCALDGLDTGIEAGSHIANKARQFVSVRVADLSRPWPYGAAEFDLVQSCFALECLPDWTAFHAAIAEAHRVLARGGVLALVNVARATNWICDGEAFATLTLAPEAMRDALDRAGFAAIEVSEVGSEDVASREQGYSSMMVTRARKPGGD